MNNWIGLLLAYVYVFSVIGLAELLRRWRGTGPTLTRKVIHVGVGMLSWLLPLLFDSVWPFVVAGLTFAVINLFDWHYGFFSAMSTSDRSNLGTVYFPVAAIAAAVLFWDNPPLMVASLMPLTWGDASASLLGQKYGSHAYSLAGHVRTVEGSASFLIVGGIFTWLALWLMPGPVEITVTEAIAPALAVIAATTVAEAITLFGVDNLTITAVSILVLSLWRFS